MNGQSNYFIEDSGLPYIHLQQPNHHVNSDEESVAAAGFVVSPKPPHPENIQQQHHRIESVEKSNKSNNYFQFNTAIQLNASSGATTNFDEFHNNNNNNNTVKHLNQFPTIASAAEWASSVTSSATPSSSSTNINDNFPLSFTPIATKRAKRKRCADDDVPDEKWECVLCHVKAHMTPLKRKNPVDGKRVSTNNE